MKISGLTKLVLAGAVIVSSMFSNKLNKQIHESNYNPDLILTRPAVGIEDNENTNISDSYLLKQNFPNPFNSSTIIQFTIPQVVETLHATSLQIRVYDITGKEIVRLIENINTSGTYSVRCNIIKTTM